MKNNKAQPLSCLWSIHRVCSVSLTTSSFSIVRTNLGFGKVCIRISSMPARSISKNMSTQFGTLIDLIHPFGGYTKSFSRGCGVCCFERRLARRSITFPVGGLMDFESISVSLCFFTKFESILVSLLRLSSCSFFSSCYLVAHSGTRIFKNYALNRFVSNISYCDMTESGDESEFEFMEWELPFNQPPRLNSNIFAKIKNIVMVLGQMFNNVGDDSPIVKVSTFIDKLGNMIMKNRIVGRSLVCYECESDESDEDVSISRDLDSISYTVGSKILGILLDKQLLELVDSPKDRRVVVKSSDDFFVKRTLYLRCIYDAKILPVKVNLPMVVKPRPWVVVSKENKRGKPATVLAGGYLTNPVDLLYRFSLVSSKNVDLFKLRLNLKVDGASSVPRKQKLTYGNRGRTKELFTRPRSLFASFRFMSNAAAVDTSRSTDENPQTKGVSKSTLRRYLLITLNHIERGNRSLLTTSDIISRLNKVFSCKSIIIGTENHKKGGYHMHVGVWNHTASKNTVLRTIRRAFPEFEGRQCNISIHKCWDTVCKYVLKEDKVPVVWGEESLELIMERARASLSKRRRKNHEAALAPKTSGDKVPKTRATNVEVFRRLCDKTTWSQVLNDDVLGPRCVSNYGNIRYIFADLLTERLEQSKYMAHLPILIRLPLLLLFRALYLNQLFIVGPILFVVVGILFSLVSSPANYLFSILITECGEFLTSLPRLFEEFVAREPSPGLNGNEQPSSPGTVDGSAISGAFVFLLFCGMAITVTILNVYWKN